MYNDGEIIRERSKKNFSIIPNEILNATDLSLRAKGLLCWMLSKPDDWTFYKKNIHYGMVEGRDAINKAWSELVDAGYIHSSPVRGEVGKMNGYYHKVYDYRVTGNQSVGENIRITGNPSVGNPVTGNPETGNTSLLNTNIVNTENKTFLNSIELSVDSVNVDLMEDRPPVAPAPPLENAQQSNIEALNFDDNTKDDQLGAIKKKAPKKQQKQKDPIYSEFIDLYHKWYKGKNEGIPPKIDGAGGKAAKSIITYLKTVVKAKAAEKQNEISEEDLVAGVLASWEYIFFHWDKIDSFYQGKTRLVDINSNIQNIINQIKNGTGKSKPAGSQITGADIKASFADIDKHFAANNTGSN